MTTEAPEESPGDGYAPPAMALEAQAPAALTPYSDAVEAYLDEADWLGVLDGPFVVQARSLARSLDRQLTVAGEVQSALASTFDKVFMRLEQRRPAPTKEPTDPHADGPSGTQSIFGFLSD